MMKKSPVMRGVKVTTSNSDYGHWDISNVGEFDPAEWFGYVYEITQKSTGKTYIGRKQFRFKRQKTKTNLSRTKPSDWLDYSSSSALVNSLIEETGHDDFEFRILKLCSGKCELNYEEENLQREKDVLRARLPNGERQYLNGTIAYKNFGGLEKQTIESRRKIAEGRTRYFENSANRLKQSEACKGIPKSEEGRRNIAIAATGQVQSEESKEKKRQSIHELRWWNNGVNSTRKLECPGDGWIAGRVTWTTHRSAKTAP